ncbi:MAG: 2-hydroxyhepta-2,4-diene-1,7-dioate isomerase, partial [Paraburkholderia tropica]
MDTWMRLMANDGSIVFGRVENGYLHEYEGL